jgi:hypothetical protein
MKATRLSLDELERVNTVSSYSHKKVSDVLAKAAWIAGDGAKERRLAAHECKGCHYSYGLSGQAFTSWRCRLCSAEGMNPNTSCPVLCDSCAETFDLCVSCGGDINMQHRSRRFGRAGKKRKAAK